MQTIKAKKITLAILVLLFLPVTVSEATVHSVETQGSIGFTGVYEPIGKPDPIPPEGIKPPEIIESAKPEGLFPKTNAVPMTWLVWLGIGILCYVFILWNHRRKHKNKR